MIFIKDLIVVANRIKHQIPAGFPSEILDMVSSEEDLSDYADESTIQNLIEEGILEEESEDTIRFSDWGQRIADIICTPNLWLKIENNSKEYIRYLYIEGVDYLCLDVIDDAVKMLFLPTIPLLIGAYAQMMEKDSIHSSDNDMAFRVMGASDSGYLRLQTTSDGMVYMEMPDHTEQKEYSEEFCVNAVTEWILNEMGRHV